MARHYVGLGTRAKCFESSTSPYRWRGVKYLCEHPASMNRAMIPREQRMKGGLKDGLIRISVGLDRARDIVDDIHNSLNLCDDEVCNVLEDL